MCGWKEKALDFERTAHHPSPLPPALQHTRATKATYLDFFRHELQKLGKGLLSIHEAVHLQAHVVFQFLERMPAFQGTFTTARGREGDSDGKGILWWGWAMFTTGKKGKGGHVSEALLACLCLNKVLTRCKEGREWRRPGASPPGPALAPATEQLALRACHIGVGDCRSSVSVAISAKDTWVASGRISSPPTVPCDLPCDRAFKVQGAIKANQHPAHER